MELNDLDQNIPCDCCGGRTVLDPDVRCSQYERYVCRACGYEKFSDVARRDYDEMYLSDADYGDDLMVSRSEDDMMLWHHWEALSALARMVLPARSTVLDVGCFNGFFVKKLCGIGYDAHGIDINRNAIAFGQCRFALANRISNSSVEDLASSGRSFDAIFLFDVLEHLPEPGVMLKSVVRLLRPNGVLVISVPNKRMCWRPALDWPPHHLSRFTPTSLRSLSKNCQLQFIFGREQMSLLELVRHFVGSFFRDKSKSSLRGGEFRYKTLTTALRRGMNSSRKILNVFLGPLNWLLHRAGIRYISQIIVVQKSAGTTAAGTQLAGAYQEH